MRSHTHSPARFTSSACAESALTLGMRRNSESSSSQSCCTVVRYFPVATAAAQPMTGRTAWARTSPAPCGTTCVPSRAERSSSWPPCSSRSSGRTPAEARTTPSGRGPLDPRRRVRHLGEPARLDQRRADGVLLPRRWARGAEGARHGRAPAAPPHRTTAGRRERRDALPDPDLPRVQRSAIRARVAGAPRWPRTRPSRSGSSPWSRQAIRVCRAFILTLCVFDDLIALIVIATAYSQDVSFSALAVAIVFFAGLLILRAAGIHNAPVSIALCLGSWVALYESGDPPDRSGARPRSLAQRLSARADRPRADDRARARVPRAADRRAGTRDPAWPSRRRSRRTSDSRTCCHPWTSYLIVPLFALANAGTHISGDILRSAVTSPITLGIFFGYVVGSRWGIPRLLARHPAKRCRPAPARRLGRPLRRSRGGRDRLHRLRSSSPTLAFDGEQLTDAKLGILAAAIGATLISTSYFMAIKHYAPGGSAARSRWGEGTR